MLEFELPYPPSINHYWRMVGRRMLISREGRAFREKVCSVLAAAGARPLREALIVRIEAYPPDRRRRDLDNALKSLLDSLQHGGAYVDDSQVVKLTIERCRPTPCGKVIVRIEEVSS